MVEKNTHKICLSFFFLSPQHASKKHQKSTVVLLLFEVAHSQIVLASINIENSARPTAQHAQVLGRYTREGCVFIFTHLS